MPVVHPFGGLETLVSQIATHSWLYILCDASPAIEQVWVPGTYTCLGCTCEACYVTFGHITLHLWAGRITLLGM
jgi:hypothetical protein